MKSSEIKGNPVKSLITGTGKMVENSGTEAGSSPPSSARVLT